MEIIVCALLLIWAMIGFFILGIASAFSFESSEALVDTTETSSSEKKVEADLELESMDSIFVDYNSGWNDCLIVTISAIRNKIKAGESNEELLAELEMLIKNTDTCTWKFLHVPVREIQED